MPQNGLQPFAVPDYTPGKAHFNLRIGKVIGTDWRDHTIDVMMNDGAVYTHIPIIEMWAGTDYGDWWHPQHTNQQPNSDLSPALTVDGSPGNLDDATYLATERRDAYALIAFIEGYSIIPVCLGFIYQEVTQMMFDGLQRLTRHVGDTFSAVTLDGNHYISFDKTGSAISFNNGFYEAPQVQLSDFDKLSRPQKGGYNITLYVAATKSRVQLNGTSGDILAETVNGGVITITSQGTIDITGGGAVTISGSPLTLNGLAGIYF